MLNYIKYFCIIFCDKLSQYSQYIHYSQKELKHFGLEILVIQVILKQIVLNILSIYFCTFVPKSENTNIPIIHKGF